MSADLHFSENVYGTGAGIFFIGYFLLEVPGSLLVEVWSARLWISRIMITWGILAIVMGFIQNKTHFYWVRFLLGAAEAGFFPGIIVYLTHWFRYQDRAKAVALFMAAIPVSNILGAPISGVILDHVHWAGLAGWQWVFILEGIPAIVLGVVTIFYLTDWPREARWLPQGEQEWLTAELEREKALKRAVHSHLGILTSLRHPQVLLLGLTYFCSVTAYYGLNLWMPKIVKDLGQYKEELPVTLITAIPYLIGLVSLIVFGRSSDRTGERRWHTAAAMAVLSMGLFLSVAVLGWNSVPWIVAMFSFAVVGSYGYLPSFWALPTIFLTESAAAASIGLINSLGNLGGYVGPKVQGLLKEQTQSYRGGLLYLAGSALVASVLVLALRHARQASDDGKS
jgi:ACS family tartrate transporter-like MFS transporter